MGPCAILGYHIRPTRILILLAKFFRVNINMYLHFMTFLRTNKTQVVEIPPRVRQGLPILAMPRVETRGS